jgi:hypothetical protein
MLTTSGTYRPASPAVHRRSCISWSSVKPMPSLMRPNEGVKRPMRSNVSLRNARLAPTRQIGHAAIVGAENDGHRDGRVGHDRPFSPSVQRAVLSAGRVSSVCRSRSGRRARTWYGRRHSTMNPTYSRSSSSSMSEASASRHIKERSHRPSCRSISR